MLASEPVNALRERVVAWCRAEGLSAYDRRAQAGFLRNLVVREGRRSGQVQARLVPSPGALRVEELAADAKADGFLWTQTAGVAETTRDGKTKKIAGSKTIDEEVRAADGDTLHFRISSEAFFQTNTEMAEVLYANALELAALTGRE